MRVGSDPLRISPTANGEQHNAASALAEHVERCGSPVAAARRGDLLIAAVDAAGLRGRGGAAFPTATKLRAVATRRGRKALVVNGTEGNGQT